MSDRSSKHDKASSHSSSSSEKRRRDEEYRRQSENRHRQTEPYTPATQVDSNGKPVKNRPPVVPIKDFDDIPIKYEDRSCTDVFCLIIGIVFSLGMLITAFCVFNYQTYVKSSFPTDSDGRLCGVDAPAYPFVYFANPPDIARRVCVSSCPKKGDAKLNCYATENVGCRFSVTPGFEVTNYDTEPDVGRIGSFCLPTDESLKNQLLQNAQLDSKYLFMNSIDMIGLSMLIALGMSVLYCVLVQCCPKVMNKFVLFAALLVLLGLTICLFIYPTSHGFKLPLGIVLAIIFFILLFCLCKYWDHIRIQGVFLQAATRMLREEKCCAFFYIPLFLAFLTGFLALLIFEFKCYWGGGQLTFDNTKSVFWEFEGAGSIVLTVFLVIQAIWGLSFLKEAFNYCISGNAVSWYYDNKQQEDWSCAHPMKTLVCKHFGSVIAGSFMTGFFTLGDYIFDLLKGESDGGCWDRFLGCFCGPCLHLFELVRSDAMAYINLTGNPYCNSARTCEYLCDNSRVMENSQTFSRGYRISSHLLLAGINGILALYIKGFIAPSALLVIFALTFFISTFFISIHADAAEAITITFLANEEWEKRKVRAQNPGFLPAMKTVAEEYNFYKQDIANEIRDELHEADQKGRI